MIRAVSRCTRRISRSVFDSIEHASNARIAARLIHRQIAHLNNVNANNTENKITLPESSEHQILNSEEEPTQSNWEYERDIKCVILDASLPFVPIHGWTKGALIAGAESIGYPGIISELFPLGGVSLVLFYYEKCNLALREYLKEKTENKQSNVCNKQEDEQERVKSFISDAIEMRLRLVIPYIDKWPTALAGLTNPRVVPHALTNLFNLVDDIAFYAGDRSADLDWYIRRVGVAGIYKVTELYMIQDKSEDYIDTWTFLRKQLDDAVTLYSYIQKSESATQFTKDISTATFTTARNMLGLNWNR